MKPSDKYSDIKLRSQTNAVWHYFQRYLLSVFTVDINQLNELARDLYVVAKPCPLRNFPQEIQEDINKLVSTGHSLGETDKDLFDYYLSSIHQPLLLIGEYGYGKSTFLYHFIHTVLPKMTIGKDCINIYLDLNLHAEDIIKKKKSVEDALIESISYEIKQFLMDEALVEQLWKFMAENIRAYAPLAGQIENFQAVVTNDGEVDKFAASLHDIFQRKAPIEYLRGVLLFLHIKKKKPILLVIDNVDILSTLHQLNAIELSYKFSHFERNKFSNIKSDELDNAVGIKCVVAIRSTSIVNLRKRHLAGLDIVVKIPKNSLNDIIDKRLKYVANLEETKRLMKDLRREPLMFEGKIYLYTDVDKAISCLQRSLIQTINAVIIDRLSNGSIRHSLAFAIRFLSSHAIPDKHLTPALFSLYIDRELPEHLFLKAIILGDNYIYCEKGMESLVSIVNVYYTPCSQEVYEFSVASRLLAYLDKLTKGNQYIPLLDLFPFCDILYPKLDLNNLLKKWLHFGIIKSAEACIADHYDEVESICLSSSGNYYFTSLIHSLFYLQWIKDDCDVGDMNIRTVVDTCGLASEQIEETLKFCDFLITKETEELKYLNDGSSERKVLFCYYCGHRPCLSYSILSNIYSEVKRIAGKEPKVKPQVPHAKELMGKATELAQQMKQFVSVTI